MAGGFVQTALHQYPVARGVAKREKAGELEPLPIM
jgi:hypothetical protein